jgi:glycerate-2-kinase
MKIKNTAALAVTDARKLGIEIIEAGLTAIDTSDVIKKNIRLEDEFLFVKERKFSLKKIDNFFVVGIGKCSSEAAAALEDVLGGRLDGGIVLDVRLSKKLKKIKGCEGSHPLATPKNIDFTKKIIEFLGKAAKKGLVLMIISGGGSALLCQPENFTCEQESETIKCLMDGGANIKEMNIARKHLSLARGGFLAKYAYPARVVSLIFSDVPGDKIEFVASGPTVKDTTTVEDAKEILKRYHCYINPVRNSSPQRPEGRASAGEISNRMNFLIETPKEDKYFEKVKNIIFISNKIALKTMADFARKAGYAVKIVNAELQGEAKEIGRRIAEEIKNEKPKTVLLYGGETTVKILGKGKGGRNQELALSALKFIGPGVTIIAFASDGRDNTDVAGAIADKLTQEKAEKMGLNVEKYLAENNSYEFFQKTGGYILTGYTGSNVSDLIVAIKS